jgi:hypothetical protein
MNRIQKAVTAAMALTITLVGAAAVTAPIAFADIQASAFRQAHVASGAQPNPTAMPRLRHV